MPSATEIALLGLVAALKTKATEDDSGLPVPTRNEDLVTRLTEIDATAKLDGFLNILDGRRAETDEFLGADFNSNQNYDIEHHAEIEFAAVGGSSDEREAAFDTMRGSIWDAIKPAVVSGAPVYLGGAVNGVRLHEMIDQQNTNLAGVPNVKAALWTVALTFTSQNPF